MSGVALLFILLIGLMMASVPVGISLGLSTLVTMVLTTNLDVITTPQYCFRGLDSFPLMAIPFFMLAGNLMKFGGLSEKLINLSNSLVRGFKGGLGHVTVLASMFFAALSGSAPATVMAIGSNVIPQMEKHGYDRGYATALASTAGTIGVIIPPSIPFVIYGVVSGASISDLFVAGIIPGILIGIVLMVVNYIYARKYGYGGEGRASFREFLHELKDAIWALLVPVIILGGIYSGKFTATEAAGVSVLYGFIIGYFVFKQLNIKKAYEACVKTGVSTSMILFLIGAAAVFGWMLTMQQIPNQIVAAISGITDSPAVVLLLVNLALFVAGALLDNVAAITLLTPVLVPLISAYGIDKTFFGIIMIINLSIGQITPPIGMNLFVSASICEVRLEKVIRQVLPFLAVLIIDLFLFTYIPEIVTVLPNALLH